MGKFWITFGIGLLVVGSVWAQGQGGGVYLEDGARARGLVVQGNKARNGFGVGGGDATVLNCTVYGNEELRDADHYDAPGDIYCADGTVVSQADYAKRATKDAIGIVYWVNTDADEKAYPKGAVVSLNELDGTYKWGSEELWINHGEISYPWYEEDDPNQEYGATIQGLHLKDTACYGNTEKMVKKNAEYPDTFQAGQACWDYKAYYQINNPLEATKDKRWTLPSLTFLRRLTSNLPVIEGALDFLRKQNNELACNDFIQTNNNGSYYWSSDDSINEGEKGNAYGASFYDGHMITMHKSESFRVRPVLLYY